LTEALAAAGIKTQSALAGCIADLEGLDTAPRDVVYRVFRQQPVDMHTLTRVARALDRPVHSLLLSAAEAQGDECTPQQEHDDGGAVPPRRWPHRLTVAAVLAVIAGVAWYAAVDTLPMPGKPGAEPETVAPRDLTDLAIVIRPFHGDGDVAAADALREALAPRARVATAGAMATIEPADSAATIAERLNADLVVEGQVMTFGRHVGMRVFAWSNGERRAIWTTSLVRRVLDDDGVKRIADDIVRALRVDGRGHLTDPPRASSHEAYLRGRFDLDRSRTELNVKRAMAHFAAAIRHDPDYARARAGLCHALVQESLISSEPGTIVDAEKECSRANELGANLTAVRRARAALARRGGRHDEAARILTAVLEEDPFDTDALLEMAENELAVYRAGGDEQARSAAIEFARHATEAEPDFWKAPFTLARIHFFTGDVDAAVTAAEAAVAADANEHSVTNLGTFYFCRGDHDQALALYLRAKDITPDASLGAEQMCVAYYFAREFNQAVEFCKAAIEIDSAGGSPATHEMWGNLADSYRQAGQQADAADAYARAAELAERALLTRGHSPNVRAHLAYYYTVLRMLDARRVPDSIAEKLPGDLDEFSNSATDPQAFIRIAAASALLGRTEEARAAYAQGTADCAGFGASPDLDAIRRQ
jgi:tetratricopeptide (TPR) repeat protein